MEPVMEQKMQKIINFLQQRFNPDWEKLMLMVSMTKNSMGYSVRGLNDTDEILTDEEDLQLCDLIAELWYEYQEHDNNWKEFVMVIDSDGNQQLDFYCDEYSYLYDDERWEVYQNKYFGLPISDDTMRYIKDPNYKSVERDKEYHQECSAEYQQLRKELTSKSVRDLWEMYCGWIRENEPDYYANLNQGCQEPVFDEFERVTGYKFPDDLKEIYLINDGENDIDISEDDNENSGIFFGLFFIPFEEVVGELNDNKELIDDEGEGGIRLLSRGCISYPEGAVREEYINEGWIPFIKDFGGNFIGIDLKPGPKGKSGQIINFGRDEDEKLVIADSVKDFLILLIYLQRFQKVNKLHFIDWLKEEYLK
ncbi:MAG TPA: SMI1/KNR4 family protein [Bacillota bacterium]|nr:SMI1/KNR4 family protein [Bacillota bacterium]